MTEFKRKTLNPDHTQSATKHLQQRLVDLIDLALQLKQAHWCVVGTNFRSVHLQLDEIILDVRSASDEVAERIATLSVAPDGRASTVSSGSTLQQYSSQFESAGKTVALVADRLQSTINGLRDSIEPLSEIDPISEDMLIAITASLEKHLWMVQAQEL